MAIKPPVKLSCDTDNNMEKKSITVSFPKPRFVHMFERRMKVYFS